MFRRLFLLTVVVANKSILGEEFANRIIESGNCLKTIANGMKADRGAYTLTASQISDLIETYMRYMWLVTPWQIFTPKAHLMIHMLQRAAYLGAPSTYDCFKDEGYNRNLKQVLKNVSQLSFDTHCLAKLEKAMESDNRKRKAA